MPENHDARPSAARVFLTLGVLLAGLIPLPLGKASHVRETLRSLDLNRADREANSGGYYESLIGGVGANGQGTRGALAKSLLGKPQEFSRVQFSTVSRQLPKDFLQFELRHSLSETLFGTHFSTNSRGMRDREYDVEKPDGVFRIALLGSSIDMGWGVGTEDTYENQLEDWLNAEAKSRGLDRKFEILNFAVAAYGIAQRYDTFHRKAKAFQPDMVIYSSTMLDPRLLEIHLSGLFKNHVPLGYPALRRAVAEAGIDLANPLGQSWAEFDRKRGVKSRIKDNYWPIADAMIGALADDCRSLGIPLVTIIVPRAGIDDVPEARSLAISRLSGIAAHHALPLIDLSGAFDSLDPKAIEIAPWDDHPNTRGHQQLFRGLLQGLKREPEIARLLLGTETTASTGASARPEQPTSP